MEWTQLWAYGIAITALIWLQLIPSIILSGRNYKSHTYNVWISVTTSPQMWMRVEDWCDRMHLPRQSLYIGHTT